MAVIKSPIHPPEVEIPVQVGMGTQKNLKLKNQIPKRTSKPILMTFEKFKPKIREDGENSEESGREKPPQIKEVKIEDFFEYSIDDIKKTTEENEEIELEDKMATLFYLSRNKKGIEDFDEENPEKLGELLVKLEDWKPEIQIEKSKEQLKNINPEMIRDSIKYRFLEEIIKFENSEPSERVRKFLDKIISLNGFAHSDQMRELDNLNPTEEEMELLGRMAEISSEPNVGYSWANSIKKLRDGTINYNRKEIFSILKNEEEFSQIENNIRSLERKFKEKGLLFNLCWLGVRLGSEGRVDEAVSEIDNIKKLNDIYNFSKVISRTDVVFLNSLPEKAKDNLFSEDFKKKAKDFKMNFHSLYDLIKFQEILANENFIEGKDDFEKIISDFGIEKIEVRRLEDLLDLDGTEINNILEKDFSDSSLRKRITPLVKKSPFYKEISSKFIENIRAIKGDNFVDSFPIELLRYISSSLTFSYLALRDKKEKLVEPLKEKNPEIYNKILQNELGLKDFIPGRKDTEKILENFGYLSAAEELNIPLDFYGVQGKNIKEIKEKINGSDNPLIKNYGAAH